MKFGGIVDSGSEELLTFEKIPKNPRWPQAPRRPFSVNFFFKAHLLLQFESDLPETWYTCSLGEGARRLVCGFFYFRLERHQMAFLSKIRFGS